MEIQWNDSCEGTTDIEEIGERESEGGKSTDLVSCKQKRDLVCAQLRIIRGNPLANTFLYLPLSLLFFLSFPFYQKSDRSLFDVSRRRANVFIILLNNSVHIFRKDKIPNPSGSSLLSPLSRNETTSSQLFSIRIFRPMEIIVCSTAAVIHNDGGLKSSIHARSGRDRLE